MIVSFPGKAVGVRVSGKAAPAKEAEVVCTRFCLFYLFILKFQFF